MKIYDTIKQHLLSAGWKIDPTATENESGELREFIEPETHKRRSFVGAIFEEMQREEDKEFGAITVSRKKKK